MLRTVQCACTLSKDEADALNAESGRLYTDMLVCHYRIYRHKGVWLRPELGERWQDAHGGPTTAACPPPRCRPAGLLHRLHDRQGLPASGPGHQVPVAPQTLAHYRLESERHAPAGRGI